MHDQGIGPDLIQATWLFCIEGTGVVNYRIIRGRHTWPC